MSNKLAYRADIDGLRAIAVLSVVIFHINPQWLPGGFLGVDIFFVISGYLITKIISREMMEKNFSFINFYKRRAKRILPVFVFVLSVTTVASLVLFTKEDFVNYNKSLLSAFLFSANLYFSRQGDYFDISSNEKPLMHIWSLSVEEQFYFIFPIVLLLGFKFWKSKMSYLILLLVIFSLLSWFLPSWGLEKYFLPHVRAYELLIGSLFSFINPIRKSTLNIILLFSLSFLGMLCLFIPKGFIWGNGYIERLLLCTAIGFIILYGGGCKENLIAKMLSYNLLVKIGLISYSLYLWHWVILSLLRYVSMDVHLSVYLIVFSIVLMFLFSMLTYRYIENPVRKIKLPNKLFLRWVCVYFSICVLIFSCYYVMNITSLSSGKNGLNWDTSSNCHGVIDMSKCTKGYIGASPKILVIGDSHAGQYNQFFHYLGIKEKWAADVISENSCNFILYGNKKVPFRAQKCLTAIEYAEKNIEKYDTVIFISNWHSRFKENGYF
ncbi:MAG: acyltransferase family protein, partial [Conchiformibius sp.]|nr:acyltransferase family protein [Conchiformibius sp.]